MKEVNPVVGDKVVLTPDTLLYLQNQSTYFVDSLFWKSSVTVSHIRDLIVLGSYAAIYTLMSEDGESVEATRSNFQFPIK